MAKKSKHKGRGPVTPPAAAKKAPAATAASAIADEALPEPAAPVDDLAHELQASAGPVQAETSADTETHADADSTATAPDAPESAPASAAFTVLPAPVIDLAPDVVDSGIGNPDDIRGVLIQLTKARLLLPNATIAEVLSYAEPDAIPGAPAWLLGRIRWRGWQLPLVALAQLAGISDERGGLGSKVVVLKALSGGKTPYFAVLTQGFPRLVTVSRTALVVDDAAGDLPEILQARVMLNQDDAYLPDLARVETMIGEALAQAA